MLGEPGGKPRFQEMENALDGKIVTAASMNGTIDTEPSRDMTA
jgi:hypothetical protein